MNINEHLLIPDWPLRDVVGTCFTLRTGGVSAAPFDSFNLGDHVRDEPQAVASNRALLTQSIGVRPVFLNQVHGIDVLAVDAATQDGGEGDGCVTVHKSVACTAMVADCLPVLFATRSGAVIGAAHAGWRGLAAGVLEATVAHMCTKMRTKLRAALPVEDEIYAWLGPCIGKTAFEVGAEVQAAFTDMYAAAAQHFVPTGEGKFHMDLAAVARQRLSAVGLNQLFGNDSSVPWCTHSNAARYFSHRRDAAKLGSTGRMAACIWRI